MRSFVLRSPTVRYVARRLVWCVPTLWAIATVTFFLLRAAPGGPFDAERSLPPAIERNLRARYQLDRPLLVQYWSYLAMLCRGDLGPSFKYKDRTVNEIVAEAFPVSAALGCFALAVATAGGVTIGLFAALHRDRVLDHATMALAVIGVSTPSFVLASILLLAFGFWLRVFPVAGWGTPTHLVLPGLTLAAAPTAYIARLMRASTIEVLGQDYIRTARAKGLSETAILFRHVLRNAIGPVVSYLGPASAAIVTGSVVVEKIFAIPGLGTHFVNGALNRDYTLVMGAVLLYSTLLVLLNLCSDIALALLDPRIRLGQRQ